MVVVEECLSGVGLAAQRRNPTLMFGGEAIAVFGDRVVGLRCANPTYGGVWRSGDAMSVGLPLNLSDLLCVVDSADFFGDDPCTLLDGFRFLAIGNANTFVTVLPGLFQPRKEVMPGYHQHSPLF